MIESMDDNLNKKRMQVPIIANVSNRHVHLSKEDFEKLFGKDYQLEKIKGLMQPGEFASRATVTIKGAKSEIQKVRVLGPLRKATQVEVSRTDTFVLGINAPLKMSGDLKGAAPIIIIGPNGTINVNEGCIVAKRHVHMTTKDADFFNVKHGDIVKIKVEGERGLIFDNVVARVREDMALEYHVDTDEANAAGIKNGDKAVIL